MLDWNSIGRHWSSEAIGIWLAHDGNKQRGKRRADSESVKILRVFLLISVQPSRLLRLRVHKLWRISANTLAKRPYVSS